MDRKDVPQGLKPSSAGAFTARLKSCPDTKHRKRSCLPAFAWRIPGLKRETWGTHHLIQDVLTQSRHSLRWTRWPPTRPRRPAQDRWRCFTLRNTILPGTTTMTSVPEPGELTT